MKKSITFPRWKHNTFHCRQLTHSGHMHYVSESSRADKSGNKEAVGELALTSPNSAHLVLDLLKKKNHIGRVARKIYEPNVSHQDSQRLSTVQAHKK